MLRAVVVVADTVAAAAVAVDSDPTGRCSPRPARSADKRPKCLSSRAATDRFTATRASRSSGSPAATRSYRPITSGNQAAPVTENTGASFCVTTRTESCSEERQSASARRSWQGVSGTIAETRQIKVGFGESEARHPACGLTSLRQTYLHRPSSRIETPNLTRKIFKV